MNAEAALPLDDFIMAVQSQLDSAQSAMAFKAQNLGLKLTFAIKDISLDLRAHVEYSRAEIRIRPAGPADKEASVFHLVFTAITRPMIEENTAEFAEAQGDASLEDTLQEELSDDERRRLEWAGVRTVSKLRESLEQGGERAIGRITRLPMERLRRALDRVSTPIVDHVLPDAPAADAGDLPSLVRIRGRNLMGAELPRVRVAGEPVSVVRGDARELVIAPRPDQMAGELTIEASPQRVTSLAFDLRPFRRSSDATGESS